MRVGLGEQRTRFNALVEFTRDVSKKGRGDTESLALADAVAQLVGAFQILIAERQIAQIAVGSPKLFVGQREFAVPLDGPFERWD